MRKLLLALLISVGWLILALVIAVVPTMAMARGGGHGGGGFHGGGGGHYGGGYHRGGGGYWRGGVWIAPAIIGGAIITGECWRWDPYWQRRVWVC